MRQNIGAAGMARGAHNSVVQTARLAQYKRAAELKELVVVPEARRKDLVFIADICRPPTIEDQL